MTGALRLEGCSHVVSTINTLSNIAFASLPIKLTQHLKMNYLHCQELFQKSNCRPRIWTHLNLNEWITLWVLRHWDVKWLYIRTAWGTSLGQKWLDRVHFEFCELGLNWFLNDLIIFGHMLDTWFERNFVNVLNDRIYISVEKTILFKIHKCHHLKIFWPNRNKTGVKLNSSKVSAK